MDTILVDVKVKLCGALQLSRIRFRCLGLILCSSILLNACGGSGTVSAPDLGAAQEQGETDPENPNTNPDTPTTDPENPTTDPETPTTDPENPTTDPETPTDPEVPQADEPVALRGSVSSYPTEPSGGSEVVNDNGQLLGDETTAITSLTRADMRPVQALVSLFLLSDVNFQTPVATVKSDASGNYNVTADDVREFLIQRQLIDDTASDEDVLSSFRTLGRLQVRALIVRERNGVRRAMAIQSLADPADVDESGAPVPVAVDPIVHRVVKVMVDSIRDSVSSLEAMGLSPAVVDQLINSVVAEVVGQIDQILAETADEVIEVPEGLTLEDVIDNQEDELALSVEPEELDQLAEVLDGTEGEPEADQLLALESAVQKAPEVADREASSLGSSLNSGSQGLLSGFESVLTDQLNGSVEQRITEAQEAGTEEALTEVFGTNKDSVALEQALATIDLQKARQSRLSIQRFFLSLGLGVVIEENEAGDAGVVALRLPLPFHLDAEALPGVAGLGERQIRLFKVGTGELDADSEYTANPFVSLSVPDENGEPMPPFKYVPALDDVMAQVLPGLGPEEAQIAVDEANERIVENALATPEDYQLLDKVDVLHDLRERLHDTTLVSSRVIDTLVEERSRTIPLKRIAATIANEFEWIQDDVKLTPEGFPIYSGRSGALAGGENQVDSSELVRALSITLGESPVATVNNLTERDSFLAQFAPRAIEQALQRFAFDTQSDLTDVLLEIYPEEPEGYRELITGRLSGVPEPEYKRERDRVSRGLTAAIPASLYGQTLTSETEVNIRSALFFLDYALRREYLIDPNRGFYARVEIEGADGIATARYVPDYSNIKKLEPEGEVSVAAMMSDLLNVTAIDDGELFRVAAMELMESLQEIPSIPEYEEYDADAFIDSLGPRMETVAAVCAVRKFDGTDPDAGEDHQRLRLAVFEVDYDNENAERFKGNEIDADITSELVQDAKGLYRKYRVSGLPTKNGEVFGRDYVLRFEIDSYQNELPELYWYADGFVPEIVLCDSNSPLFIGPDQTFFQLPGVGLVSNQIRFNEQPVTEPGSVVDGSFEWIDLSNFEVPGAPLYLTELEESKGLGIGDFRLENDGDQFRLVGPTDGDIGFARLYGSYIDGKLNVSLQQNESMMPLFGLNSVIGASMRDVVASIASGESSLTDTLFIAATEDSAAGTGEDTAVDTEDGTLLADAADEVQSESLYLFRDSEGRFWVLELSYFDTFIDFDGSQRAVIDIRVAAIDNVGLIDVPKVAFDNVPPDNTDNFDAPIVAYYSLNYGDWLVLENPTSYQGPDQLPAEALAFGPSEEYGQLGQAIDGVILRFAGDHFDENIQTVDDIEAKFGLPPDFSSVPARLDAGREGISFVKLAFDRAEKRYVMNPLPQDAAPYVSQLKHNDLVAIFDNQSADDGPVYLARVVRDFDDSVMNGVMALEVMRYDTLSDNLDEFDERQVVCFFEDDFRCPDFYPPLFSAIDAVNVIGIVYDNDVDGVPALFDPNDNDPNIPGIMKPGDGYPGDSGDFADDELAIESVAGVADDGSTVRALIARTNHVYTGDIESITLQSDVFGLDSPAQSVLSCEPPVQEEFGIYSGVRCTALSTSGDVELEIFRQSEYEVSLLMMISQQTLDALTDPVDFTYQIDYHTPTDADGQPLFCGEDICEPRSASSGVISLAVGRDIPVHGQVTVQVQGEEPMELLGLRELDVDRELRFSAAALPGAMGYRLNVYCPASSQANDFNAVDYYQPEENLEFYSPGHDDVGLPIPPEFDIHIPWLSGRECELSLRTRIKDDAGNIAGVSLYLQDGVMLRGSADKPVFIDNESAFRQGDSVCLQDDVRLTAENCTAAEALFTIPSLEVQADIQGRTLFDLGADVIRAEAYGQSNELLQTTLQADMTISFDGIVDNMAPTCGAVEGPAQSYSSCQTETSVLQAAFVVDADGQEMRLLLQDVLVQGPVNEQGVISLLEPGYYSLVRTVGGADSTAEGSTDGTADGSADGTADGSADGTVDGSADGTAGDSATATADGTVNGFSAQEELMSIMIEVYDDPTGVREVFARFEIAPDNDFFTGDQALRQIRSDVPGYVFIQTAQGHEVGLDLRAIIDEHLKLTFHVHKPLQATGVHDLNQDGVSDIEVVAENGFWQFFFLPSVDGVRDPAAAEGQEVPADPSGNRLLTFSADQEFTELFVRIGDTEYLVFASFHADGFSELQVVDQYPVAEELIEPLFDGMEFEQFFPVELSAASPFTRDELAANVDLFADGSGETSFLSPAQRVSAIVADADRIAGILRGRFKLAEFFRTGNLRASSTDAHCFGPTMFYQNHPDGEDGEPMADPVNGELPLYPNLPGGDLGIWTEYDRNTGDACAAAQMNAQLRAARRRTFSGLVTLASVARRLSPQQQADVLSGAEVSVAEQMNALSLPNVVFEQASVSRQPDTGEWLYRVMLFENTPDGAGSHMTSIELDFDPGDELERWDYSGAIRFRVQDDIDSSVCQNGAVEHLSSLAFQRDTLEQLKTEYRYGLFCGHGGDNGFDADGMVDPAYSSLVADNGWSHDFSVFTANVRPSSGAGRYAYSWQAGVNDSHSRVLNVTLNDMQQVDTQQPDAQTTDAQTSDAQQPDAQQFDYSQPIDGEAWYGYGQSLTNGIEMAGEINGFICNWAGPGNVHRLLERAQRQSLVYDFTTDRFIVPDGGSNITYAPTVACTYNSDEGGSFLYDRNLDGSLADESAQSVDVGEGELLLFDLAPPASSTYFGMPIEEVIQLRGFVRPERPLISR